ncbi:MAG: hypothetical protein PHX34_05725 [Candidatus Shapirobacteria bacterium]|nr:hypothetical protein [Candidatus Shapirobacteria bacterium]
MFDWKKIKTFKRTIISSILCFLLFVLFVIELFCHFWVKDKVELSILAIMPFVTMLLIYASYDIEKEKLEKEVNESDIQQKGE